MALVTALPAAVVYPLQGTLLKAVLGGPIADFGPLTFFGAVKVTGELVLRVPVCLRGRPVKEALEGLRETPAAAKHGPLFIRHGGQLHVADACATTTPRELMGVLEIRQRYRAAWQ